MNVDLVADPLSHALLMAFTSVTPDRTAFGVGMVRWDNNGPWRIQDRWAFSGASLFRATLKLTQDRVYAKCVRCIGLVCRGFSGTIGLAWMLSFFAVACPINVAP